MAFDFGFLNILRRSAAKVKTRGGVKVGELAAFGTENYGGYLETETHPDLIYGRTRAELFDEMHRSDYGIARMYKLIRDSLLASTWEFRPKVRYAGNSEAKKQVEILNYIFFERLRWKKILKNYLTMLKYGYTIFEKTYEPLAMGPYGALVAMKSLKWISPQTIEKWNIDTQGHLVSVEQQAYGDDGRIVDIPQEYLSHVAIEMEGANFEGISLFRHAYGIYTRKKDILLKKTFGNQRASMGVPSLTEEEDKTFSKEEINRATEALKKFSVGANNFMLIPAGYKFEGLKLDFDAEKAENVVNQEDMRYMKLILADFINLGQGKGASGSFALGSDLSKIFLTSCQYYCDLIADEFNDSVVDEISRYNFKEPMAEICYSGVTDKIGKEMGQLLSALFGSGIVKIDEPTEELIRKRTGLPAIDYATRQEDQAPAQTPGNNDNKGGGKKDDIDDDDEDDEDDDDGDKKTKQSEIYQLGATANRRLHKTLTIGAENLKEDLRGEIRLQTKAMQDRAVKALKNGTEGPNFKIPREEALKVIKPQFKGVREQVYSDSKAIYEARLGETDKKKFAGIAKKSTRNKKIDSMSISMAVHIVNDLEKYFMASYLRFFGRKDAETEIVYAIGQASEKYISSPSFVASVQNSITEASNLGIMDLEQEILEGGDKVESYTYVNVAPVSAICKWINGKSIKADSPDLDRFSTPLHHNCKTSVIINTSKTRGNPKDVAGRINPPKSALKSASLIY